MKKVGGKEENSGDPWGLAVLRKPSASLRVNNSIHRAKRFENLLPHVLLLANSIRYRHNLTEAEWPIQWINCSQVY